MQGLELASQSKHTSVHQLILFLSCHRCNNGSAQETCAGPFPGKDCTASNLVLVVQIQEKGSDMAFSSAADPAPPGPDPSSSYPPCYTPSPPYHWPVQNLPAIVHACLHGHWHICDSTFSASSRPFRIGLTIYLGGSTYVSVYVFIINPPAFYVF